ncbi:MAG: TetR/AcrR family transcriptional regulator [Candidatus Binatia bacterium]
MIDAIARSVASKGYAATTVADVVTLARLSRRTFYEQFADKEECFLAAFDDGVEFLLRQIRERLSAHPEADWRTRVRLSIEAYLAGFVARPTFAWALTIEAVAVGPRILERRAAIFSRWVAQWRALQQIARAGDPRIPETPDDRLLMLVAGIEELVRECLRTRGAKHLPELAPAATAAATATLGG